MHFIRTAIVLAPLLALVAAAPAQNAAVAVRDEPTGGAAASSSSSSSSSAAAGSGSAAASSSGSASASAGGNGNNDDQPNNNNPVPGGNTYFLNATNIAPDNSTATLNTGGNGTIAALGDFNAVSGVLWTTEKLEVGYTANVSSNTLGGGYTINKDGISVGAGIGFGDNKSTSFSLGVSTNGTVVASVFGTDLKCVVEGNKATCSNN
ncbi:hypothetical protein A4X09_0g6030 [Tilletia walkeri]|uniref:Hyphally-regulated cell wall protein N-terminal domain-containing protein n=1 Tax=Tilletia walkeri TaxID=117179 RepID=A0A8X7T327_9BASI|nr:hypothetical protein A4X09_0g6030 [Tilletia walkeri]